MSIRHGILALLRREPMYGYQLRTALEGTTAGTWPLNIGQIYTTLGRLERDGLVHPLPQSETGQRPYELTAAGEASLNSWFATPLQRTERPRDELAIKLALALDTPGVDVRAVIQTQRAATMRTLQEYTRLKSRGPDPADLSWSLVLDSLVFSAEAEIRWLDHCEAWLARTRPTGTRARPEARPPSAPTAEAEAGSPTRKPQAHPTDAPTTEPQAHPTDAPTTERIPARGARRS